MVDNEEPFFDYVDPASGSLMLGSGTSTFSEVEFVETFLTFQGFKVV